MKQQINFRASELTAKQIAHLVDETGMNQTEVISIAIDRMYREDTMNKNLYEKAQARIEKMGFTQEQQGFIFADWNEGDEHFQWLLKASKKEIVSWGEAANWGKEE